MPCVVSTAKTIWYQPQDSLKAALDKNTNLYPTQKLSEKINSSFPDKTIRGWISINNGDSELMKTLYKKGMVIEEGIDELGLVQLHVEIQKDRPFEFLSNKKIRTTNKQEAFIEELI